MCLDVRLLGASQIQPTETSLAHYLAERHQCEVVSYNIAEEHLATGLLSRSLTYTCGSEPPKAPGAPRIVVRCHLNHRGSPRKRVCGALARLTFWQANAAAV